MSNSHQQGMIDAIKLWGTVCGQQGNCETCPIGSLRGANVTCQDFAKQFPAKMLSILKEMNEGEINYYQEYCTRFPECNLPVEVLAECACRKAIFEGYCDCEGGDCKACWEETYIADVTEVSEAQ
jgi:hypothetical protein